MMLDVRVPPFVLTVEDLRPKRGIDVYREAVWFWFKQFCVSISHWSPGRMYLPALSEGICGMSGSSYLRLRGGDTPKPSLRIYCRLT